MSRRLKEWMVRELTERYRGEAYCLLVDYQGLTAEECAALRRELASRDARMEVVKNAIAARAFEAAGLSVMNQFLEGPSAVVRGAENVAALCKVVTGWRSQRKTLRVRGGMLDGAPITPAQAEQLARIPSMDALRSQLLTCLQAPLARFLGALHSIPSSLARGLDALRQKKADEASGGPPSEEEQQEQSP